MIVRRDRGFTLIETILYVAFTAMILTSVVLLASTALNIRSRVRASLILEENVRFATGRIRTLVTEASGITTPAAGTVGSTLVLVMASSTSNPTTVTLTGGVIMLTQGTGTALALTSNEVAISALTFTRLTGTVSSTRIVLTGGLRNATASYPTMTVTTTASIPR